MPKTIYANSLEITVKNDPSLDALYNKRKQSVKAPASTRSFILAKAKSTQVRASFNLWNWTLGVSLCTALLVLFQYVGLSHRQIQPQYNVIQVHRLYEESQPLELARQAAQQTRIQHADNYARYMQSQQVLATHHKLNAELVETANGWGLQTCDRELVLLTTQLVDQLRNHHRLEQQLKKGDQVEIAFDAQGRILTIKPTSKLNC